MLNLGINARSAIGDRGGEIHINLDIVELDPADADVLSLAPRGYAALSVRDTGTGIKATDLDHIFDPFFTTKPRDESSGLGLASAHGIVRRHQGAISVDTRVGEGTTFRVLLPLSTNMRTGTEDHPTPAPAGDPPLRILLVDDEVAVVRSMHRLLLGGGFEVVPYESSTRALAAFRASPFSFDIGLFDQDMPRLSGSALIEAIRSLRPDFPVVVATGHAPAAAEKLAPLGRSVLLAKPCSPDELFAALSTVAQDHDL
ncbi:MAG: ATP-binding protein [Nannocystaceae bacterium]